MEGGLRGNKQGSGLAVTLALGCFLVDDAKPSRPILSVSECEEADS